LETTGEEEMTAGDIMDRAAALLNDSAKTIYAYQYQLPYLNMALDELKEIFQLNNVPVTSDTSSIITVNAGVLGIGGVGQPPLPTGLVSIIGLYERPAGTSSSFIRMTPVDFVPKGVTPTAGLRLWDYTEEVIHFIGSTQNNDVQIDFIKEVIPSAADSNTAIPILNSKSFLSYRTASLCADFIGENQTRAAALNNYAVLAIDRALGIDSKARQNISTRRRPFMAGYRGRHY
jgi:hypothetical protein